MSWVWRIVLSLEALPRAVRLRAVQALGAAQQPNSVPALLKARAGRDVSIAEAAGIALKSLGTAALAPLVARLESVVPLERASAAEALGLLGKDARSSVQKLLGLLVHDPQLGVKLKAGEALGRIGPGSAEAIPELIQWLNAKDSRQVDVAARALGGLGPIAKDALPILVGHATHVDKAAREAVAESIGKIGSLSRIFVP